MKYFLTLLIPVFVITSLPAQIEYEGEPMLWDDTEYSTAVDVKVMPEVDLGALTTADAVTDQFKDVPWRFGVEQNVAFNLENSGVWTVEDGIHVWRLGFNCPDALNVSLFLSRFVMPKGGKLVVWNETRTEFLGAFTHENNKEWESLSIGLLEGSTIVLEYQVTPAAFGMAELEVGQVIHGYRSLLNRPQDAAEDMQSMMGPFGNSGACNININCPEGAAWQTEKRSVALIVSGGYAACTGALVNNTANDGTPFFLTANHCLGNPSSWVYYFNHESSSCSGSTGPTNQTVSGGSLLVSNGGSDFALIQLSSTPPSSYNVEYAGWDNSGYIPSSAAGIHHPSGDVKKICFENNSPSYNSVSGAAVWWIDQWEDGVTEPGSSGSPLFDNNHRIIGQLFGGAAACSGSSNNGHHDYYGRFNVSWGLGASQYLDPLNSGVEVLNSYPTNAGPVTTYGCTNPTACNYNAAADEDDGTCIDNGVNITFTVLTDNYPTETTWTVTDESGATVMSGGPYSSSGTSYSETACVDSGCYLLTINDEYGDGICCSYGVGNYAITLDGETLAAGGEFADSETTNFCVDNNVTIPGCTNMDSCNYDAEATVDDGSCESTVTAYIDSDSDGYGDISVADACEPLPSSWSLVGGDCDDSNPTVHPGAPGTGEDIDNNCDNVVDGDELSPSCSGDVNGDNAITVADVLLVLSEFGCTSNCDNDVTGDEVITVADILELLSLFGQTC